MKRWLVVGVVWLGVCGACARRTIPSDQSLEPIFTFSGGPCPSYGVEVFEDLGARFTGSRDTKEADVVWFKLSERQLEALRSLELRYWAKKLLAGGCGYDVAHCLRVEKKLGTKWVGTCLCEAEIGTFEKDMLSIVGATEWAASQRACPESPAAPSEAPTP